MAPETFSRVDGHSAVTSQPTSDAGKVEAAKALLSCPTNSIHATKLDPTTLQSAQKGLPAPVPGCPGIYHCGWHSRLSFAATSYLIQRPEGNILMDSPRYNPVLARQIRELGGAKYMFLSHKDDVADHEQWAQHLGCARILHTLEVDRRTTGVEVKLEGEGPWKLPDGGDDVELIFTPGHTRGHVCLLHKPTQTLFTGDHLCSSEGEEDTVEGEATGLYVFQDFNWYSFPQQLESVAALRPLPFLHVLPGHGRQHHFSSVQEKDDALDHLLSKHGYSSRVAA